jgi:hypothetical protein
MGEYLIPEEFLHRTEELITDLMGTAECELTHYQRLQAEVEEWKKDKQELLS